MKIIWYAIKTWWNKHKTNYQDSFMQAMLEDEKIRNNFSLLYTLENQRAREKGFESKGAFTKNSVI